MGTTRKFDPSEPVLAHLANLKAGLQAIREAAASLIGQLEADAVDDAILALSDRVQEIERKLIELPAFTLHPLARARLFGDMFDPPYHSADTEDLAVGDLRVDEVVSEHGLRTDRPKGNRWDESPGGSAPRERVCVLELAVEPTAKPTRGWWQAQYGNGESVRILAGPHCGRTGVITSVGLMSYEVDLDPIGS